MEWEPLPDDWDPTIKHYWQARYIKVIELAVATCGVPLKMTKFPFAEGERNVANFMNAAWPTLEQRPTYLAIDIGCKVIRVLNTDENLDPPTGWLTTTNIKVDPFHYNGHGADSVCITLCNPNDRTDPNLIEAAPSNPRAPYRADARSSTSRAQARRAIAAQDPFKRSFNFEAAEHLNAWLEPFSATVTKMKPQNFDLFLCILLQLRAESLNRDSRPLL